jgi:hypothetical protein
VFILSFAIRLEIHQGALEYLFVASFDQIQGLDLLALDGLLHIPSVVSLDFLLERNVRTGHEPVVDLELASYVEEWIFFSEEALHELELDRTSPFAMKRDLLPVILPHNTPVFAIFSQLLNDQRALVTLEMYDSSIDT